MILSYKNYLDSTEPRQIVVFNDDPFHFECLIKVDYIFERGLSTSCDNKCSLLISQTKNLVNTHSSSRVSVQVAVVSDVFRKDLKWYYRPKSVELGEDARSVFFSKLNRVKLCRNKKIKRLHVRIHVSLWEINRSVACKGTADGYLSNIRRLLFL